VPSIAIAVVLVVYVWPYHDVKSARFVVHSAQFITDGYPA